MFLVSEMLECIRAQSSVRVLQNVVLDALPRESLGEGLPMELLYADD